MNKAEEMKKIATESVEQFKTRLDIELTLQRVLNHIEKESLKGFFSSEVNLVEYVSATNTHGFRDGSWEESFGSLNPLDVLKPVVEELKKLGFDLKKQPIISNQPCAYYIIKWE